MIGSVSGEFALPVLREKAHHVADKCGPWACESDSEWPYWLGPQAPTYKQIAV